MRDYSPGVALFDFLPVLLTALAMAFLARAIARRHRALSPVAWSAALLIPFGGACKASWKLLLALHQQPSAWLENLLFIALAPGFAAMGFSMFHARRAWQASIAPQAASYPAGRLLMWLALPLFISMVAAWLRPESRLWFFCLLGATTLANASLLAQCIAASRWSGTGWTVTACLVYNFVATISLSGLSRLPAGESTAWIQEGVNLAAQAAIAYGFWRLGRRMQYDRAGEQ